jgi:hypothetical protein
MKHLFTLALLALNLAAFAQVVINEGSNKNYSTVSDEDGEFPDWIEIHNAGPTAVNLLNYSLSDDPTEPTKWTFPNITLQPGEYKVVFCSGKDRKPITGFTPVLNTGNYTPIVGWNLHNLSTPMYWDDVSNLLINMCAYSNSEYTTNSVMRQSATSYPSTLFAFQDGSNAICQAQNGTTANQRPNMRFNNTTVGTGTIQNGNTDYPAPYGNWYWAAKHQMIFRASELSAAGLSAGNINTISFNVAGTDPNTLYNNIEFSMKLVSETELNSNFTPLDTNVNQHTNFRIASSGETVYLYSPSQTLLSNLTVNVSGLDHSVGSQPDASPNIALFQTATPRASNNASTSFSAYLLDPSFDVPPGLYLGAQQVTITNPNTVSSEIRYTLDGSDPTPSSALYTPGSPVSIVYAQVLKAKAFGAGYLPSNTTSSSYLIGVSHTTPILSVVTDDNNLYGPSGIFDNWQFDWEKAAHVDYFDEQQQLLFSQNAGMQIDGGAGGSRSHPQHSFRIELDDPVLGEGKVNHALIPNKPFRDEFSKLYLRNGSNQYLVLPYKDAVQVETMCGETNTYYSAWRPVTVYINGQYFGLYELREKYDTDFFEQTDGADPDSMDLLSLSYWNGSVLRAVEGSVDGFWDDVAIFNTLSATSPSYWSQADQLFDMEYYVDYIISESWMGNNDWPQNNIKIYRSNASGWRWRFCTIDLELSLQPNGWTDRYFNHIDYMLNQNPGNPYINIWLKGMQNQRFRRYFINRFADLMNTSYQFSRIGAIENEFYNLTVPEMDNEYMRWGNPNNLAQQMAQFSNNHLVLRDEMSDRTDQVRDHIESSLNLQGQVDITLAVTPAGAGKIKINTIVPQSLPWTGVYFDGNPVEITVLPNPGYQFLYWSPNSVMPTLNTNAVLDMNVGLSTTFTANFVQTGGVGAISISELNYHPDSTRDGSDWVELHNHGTAPLDLSGWRFNDGAIFNNFVFPNGTTLAPSAYLVLAEDSLLFKAEYPSVTLFGELGFGFSNSGEQLSIFDASNSPVLQMTYSDQIPWPQAADGFGRTLELANVTADPNLPGSWFHGCVGGSPGAPYSPCPEAVVFGELNYSSAISADAGDWVELFNTSNSPLNISNWKFSDNDDTHQFVIPAGTTLPAQGRLVLVVDNAKFSNRFPNVQNKLGPIGFGFSSLGEELRLYDNTGKLYNSMYYSSANPWPLSPSGGGYTLELSTPTANLCEASSWFAGCPEGSPGIAYVQPCLTGVSNSEYGGISLFPNPSDGSFQVLFDESVQGSEPFVVRVYSILGERVYEGSFNSTNIQVKLEKASGGVYLVEIMQGKQVYRSNLVIQP